MKDEPRKPSGGGGLSVKTLLIAGATSAITAFLVPLFWEPGTVFAAAMTPIIAAVVTELLRRPVDTVSAVTTRRTTGGAVILEKEEPDEPFDPLAPVTAEELDALPETASQRSVARRRRLTPRQWKLALVTGLVAFAGAVFVVTAGELLAGEQVGGGDNATTFFSGSRRTKDKADEKQTPTPTATPEGEEEATPTPTPTSTPTPAATETPTPTATPAPLTAEPTATPTPAP